MFHNTKNSTNTTSKNNRRHRGGLTHTFTQMTLIPLLILSVISLIVGLFCISTSLSHEVSQELKSQAKSFLLSFDQMYPGDYSFTADEDTLLIYKGDTLLSDNFSYIDEWKEATGLDYSLFYQDYRVLTTLTDSNGQRLNNTAANYTLKQDVLTEETPSFYNNIKINKSSYYCFYQPIYNSDNTCIGMIATGMPAAHVWKLILRSAWPLVLVFVLMILAAFFWSHNYSREFLRVIRMVNTSLGETAKGHLSNTVPAELLAREDEFSDMAHSILTMQEALRKLVEQDVLTGLNNRRFGQQRLDKLFENTAGNDSSFSIALGDIDFFKKFNDTYGHDCGDHVLQEVSHLLQELTQSHGYCIRWGGEEFLIVFSQGTFNEHKKVMEELIHTVANHTLVYDEQELHLTMTFGLLNAKGSSSTTELIRMADELLYYGKEHGRNQLVCGSDAIHSQTI